jgi:hypothetical protein
VEYLAASCDSLSGAWQSQTLDEDPIVENAFIKFTNGISASVTIADGFNVRLSGRTGVLEVPANGIWIELDRQLSTTDPYQRERQKIVVEPLQSGTQRAFSELASAVRDGHATGISAREIEQASAILLGCAFSSLQGGRRISLAELPDDFLVTGRFGELYA